MTRLISKKDLIDPNELLQQAIASGMEAGYSEVDDSDVKRANNVVEWLTGASFLNVKPFAKQIEDAIHFFTAACYFCSDTPYLIDIPTDASLHDILEHSTLMRKGKCPKCKRKLVEMRHEWCLDPNNTFEGRIKSEPPNELTLLKGQRSGKSVETAMFSTWILHMYLGLANPSRWFRLLKRQVLYGTFVSVTANQAAENLWQPFVDLIEGSPWFQEYHGFLNEEGERLGVELWNKKETYLWYGHKRLALSYAPADVRTLRGRTRWLSAIDELGWFGSARGKEIRLRADGDGTHRALDRSLATVRTAADRKRETHQSTPDGYMLTLSSPSARTDPIMRRAYKAAKSPRVYYIRHPTWVANPMFTEDSLRAQEGDVSETEFMCDFGCIPPYSEDPWWESKEQLMGLCRKDNTDDLFTYSIEHQKDPLGDKVEWIWSKVAISAGDKSTPRVLALDTGEKSCSFSWCVSRFNAMEDSICVEDLGEVAPGEGQRIHLGNMWEHTIKPLVQNFRFLHVVWDRWESSTYVSDLRTELRVRAEQYTAIKADCNKLRSDMMNGKLSLPQPEVPIEQLPIGDNVGLARWPKSHLLLQVLTVREGNGVPFKPQGGNDDTFRCVLLGGAYIRENEKAYSYGMGERPMRFIGIGPGGRGRGRGVVLGAGGRAMGVGPRR